MAKRTLIQGVGINDADYKYRISEMIGGKRKIVYQCKIHSMWKDLLRRCYNKKHKEKYPHYKEVTCCEEWLLFSNFKNWVDSQGDLFDRDGRVKQLDKDLLVIGNKFYCPANCIIVSGKINNFFLDGLPRKGSIPKGVCFNKEVNKFHVFCKDPLNRYSKYIGAVPNEEEGRILYNKTKNKYFKDLLSEGYLELDLYEKLNSVWFGDEGVFPLK